jgi:prepilin-type N-terminal cleavage/methylation domain-containing protein
MVYYACVCVVYLFNMSITSRSSGFTIVELLIVVVVIAILAVITIVSYNGIQNRAKNQQTVGTVRAYYTTLGSIGAETGSIPVARGCLGSESFYNSNPCYTGATGTSYYWINSLNAVFNKSVGTQPSIPNGTVSGFSITAKGIFYDNPTGASGAGYIGFPVFGASSCPVVAGAEFFSTTVMGSDMYCRIKNPTF